MMNEQQPSTGEREIQPVDTLSQEIATGVPTEDHADLHSGETSGLQTERRKRIWMPPWTWTLLTALFAVGIGLEIGYIKWGLSNPATTPVRQVTADSAVTVDPVALPEESVAAALPTSYTLQTTFGGIGPQLLEAGAFDLETFAAVYQSKGLPLTAAQRAILTEGSDEAITVDAGSSYFLLNFFWALGLTNQNPILTEGLMQTNSGGQIERFASTGGWTLATIPIPDLYASTPIIELTPEQQALVEEVASAAYRPCCDNHTAFPDCNHGMALLGMLQLMAAQGADADAMFEAAKYANLFWFPQQSQEIATLVKVTEGQTYADADARTLVSANYASGSGFRTIHQWLVDNGHLGQPQGGGNSCGV
jgi:hypothetical protein